MTPHPPSGVRALDHTADVGISVRGASLEELFVRAALGAVWMAAGTVPDDLIAGAAGQPHEADGRLDHELVQVSMEAEDREGLLRSWLRELLFRLEVDGRATVAVERIGFMEGGDGGFALTAQIRTLPAPESPVREIKGVTWHGLVVRPPSPVDSSWRAQVIFDV